MRAAATTFIPPVLAVFFVLATLPRVAHAQCTPVEETVFQSSGTVDIAVDEHILYLLDRRIGLRILDTSDPLARELGQYRVLDGSAIARRGTDIIIADEDGILYFVDCADPTRPRLAQSRTTPGPATKVAAFGNTLCVAWVEVPGVSGRLRLYDIADIDQTVLLGEVPCGTVEAVATGGGLAIVAGRFVQVFDIGDRQHPTPIGLVDGASLSLDVVYRDRKAYIAHGTGRLVVADLSDPGRPVTLSRARLPGTPGPTGLAVVDGVAYVAGGGLTILDVGDPAAPALLATVDRPVARAAFGADKIHLVQRNHAVRIYDVATCSGCPADLDRDGSLTIFDFLSFLGLFEDDDPAADFDGDGRLTVLDFLAFQDAFAVGCP